MMSDLSWTNRRRFLAASVTAGAMAAAVSTSADAAGLVADQPSGGGGGASAGGPAIRPFHFTAPEADLVDLRRRIAATRPVRPRPCFSASLDAR